VELSVLDHVHEFYSSEGALGGLERLEPQHGAGDTFYRVFTWANFLYHVVNKSVKCDFLGNPSGYKPLTVGKSNT
jgi:hypothetical protein